MKYIDAEKLIAEIKIIQSSLENRDVRFNQVKKIRTESMIEFCKSIFGVIASLQQEQPSPRWIHANYSDKPEVRYTPSGAPYLQNGPFMIWLSDLESLPKDGTDLTNPGPEQPEVDLKKEIQSFWNANALAYRLGHIADINFLAYTARHFAEWGAIHLNARKEE